MKLALLLETLACVALTQGLEGRPMLGELLSDTPLGMGLVRNPVLSHRVRLFALVPLVWESNPIEPKLQGGWCKTQPPGR